MITHRPDILKLTTYGPNDWDVKDVVYFHYLKVRDGEPIIAKMKNLLKYNQILDWD